MGEGKTKVRFLIRNGLGKGDGMKYLSKEWLEAVREKANADTEYLKKTRGLTVMFQLLTTDVPGGVDKLSTWNVERGKIKSITLEEKPAPSDWRTTPVDLSKYLLRGTAPYQTFCALHRKEFPFVQAMTKGFKVDGDMMKIMSKVAEFVHLLEFQANVPAEY